MQLADWIILISPLLLVLGIGIYANRYVRSVAVFLSGGRLAGRYLLAVARGEMQAGAVVFVAAFEVFAKSGFSLVWWNWINNPLWVIIGISGFVIYRYRETRAMTLAQFFEIRYSKSFRLFTGALGFLAGITNFGIIPAVGAQFFVHFLGLPPSVTIFSISLPTYILLMALFLSVTVTITIVGGLITLMITDCIEGIISQIFYLALIAGLVLMFDWSQIRDVLGHRPPGQSLINPFDSMGLKDFNLWYVLMGMFGGLYATMAWQYQSSYNSASITPHESRMGGILSGWRETGKGAIIALLAVCGMTFLQHPDFAIQAASVHAEIARISDPQTREQMQIPIALSHLLPTGLRGAFCAILLMGLFGGDSVHLHSWGSIFVQDVLVPLRKKPFGPRQHIFALRLSMIGVAVFAFFFGSLFRQTEYIMMWWSVTGALYVGGAGAAIIGGLYWKKGTAAGAWAAMISGSALSAGGILARQFYGDSFPLNGREIGFYSSLIAITLYIVVSLLTHKEDFNMERMLHRGRYAVKDPLVRDEIPVRKKSKIAWGKLIGLDENFTRGDRWIAIGLFVWNMFWFAVFVAGTLWNLIAPWPDSAWSVFWHIAAIGLPLFVSFVTAIWFTWGGLRDIFALFRQLHEAKANHLDDGTVIRHQNMDELALPEKSEEPHVEPEHKSPKKT
ncbi:MAG TPA: sodium:proline symporter [Opitutaceae bacterium]|nr:sodium:proline symporter [Opitutaceae bacterium]